MLSTLGGSVEGGVYESYDSITNLTYARRVGGTICGNYDNLTNLRSLFSAIQEVGPNGKLSLEAPDTAQYTPYGRHRPGRVTQVEAG